MSGGAAMYGPPPSHGHHLQHAHHHTYDTEMHRDQQNPHGLMEGSHYNTNEYSYPFQGLHNSSPMMPVHDHTAQTHPYPNGGMPQHQGMTSMYSNSPTSAVPRASIDAGFSKSKPNLAPSPPRATRDRNSPVLADTLDDPATDEFELSAGRADGTDLGGKVNKNSQEDNAPPPWSELKTKAGKDRKRLPLACIACRRKKIRCSGEKPACKHCLRSRIPCVYKVTTRKAAPRTDYMAMLDKRLKRMEERIIKVIPKNDQDKVTSNISRAVVKPAIPGMATGAKAGSKKRGAEEAFGPGLDAWAKAATKAKLSGEEDITFSNEALDADENKLFQEGTDALPPKDVQEHLAEVYFDNVYGQAYHLLHKPSYMRKLKNNSLPPVLVLSVCAVAARFSVNPKFNSPTRQFLRGEEWAAPAREICSKRYETPNITILTCSLILALHELGTCQGGRSWGLGGQAIRMAFALKLHKDLEYDPMGRKGQQKLSFVDREIRRRIMWACFILDRFISSGSDRPMFIKESDMKIPLPVKERYFQLDMPVRTETLNGEGLPGASPEEDAGDVEPRNNMGTAAYMIRAIALWGRIVAYVNQGGKERDAHPIWIEESEYAKLMDEAEDFSSFLPEQVKYSTENMTLHGNFNTTNQLLLLHVIIQQNILSLGRAALASPGEASSDFISMTRENTLAAANRISAILKDAEGSRYSITAPFAAYCAFSSTAVLIRGIVSGCATVKQASEANSTVNVRFLRKMMKFWGMFHWLEDDIRSQYRSAMDKSRSGVSSEDIPQAPILQYGDWFSVYPHGVADSDFLDAATQKKKEKGADGVLEQKPELQSVEEFFTTLSSPQASEDGTGSRKRKAVSKRQSIAAGVPGQRVASPVTGDVNARRVSTPNLPHAPQQRRVSQIHTTGPAGYDAHAAPHSAQSQHSAHSQSFHTVSPMSPMTVNQFGHPQSQQAYFSPDMLAMQNIQQPPNSMMQPLDLQLSFGDYSMASQNMPGSQDTMNGAQEWTHENGPSHGEMPNNHHEHAHVVPNGVNGHPHNIGEQNGGWYMPNGMPYGIQNHDVDPNMAMHHGNHGVDGLYTNAPPNPLGGLRHAP